MPKTHQTKLTITLDWYFEDADENAPKQEVVDALVNEFRSWIGDSSFRRGIDDQLGHSEYGTFYIDKVRFNRSSTTPSDRSVGLKNKLLK